jgi:hypothetical protein
MGMNNFYPDETEKPKTNKDNKFASHTRSAVFQGLEGKKSPG